MTFAVFFVAVYVVHLMLLGRPLLWKWAMLTASFVFYGWWDWRFCGLIALSTGVNWLAATVLSRAPPEIRRAIVAAAVVFDLGLLGLFKYYGFFVEALSRSVGSGPLPVIDLLLPVGISFFTFQAMSYVIDVYRAKLTPRSLLDVAVYLAFFPQLVAGPIVRAVEFLPQLDRLGADSRPKAPIEVSEASWLIGRGLFKKLVVATYLSETVVDPVFAAPSLATRTELAMALYGYAVQIYADFSGYTDMATGIALLLGFRFPVNFHRPYSARSIQAFWRRWHMTLSRWLRDYLYVPLGGSRGSTIVTYRNLMATMLLGGLWHGAAWTFVAWGGVHGLALSVERAIERRRPEARPQAGSPNRLAATGQWLLTFHVVAAAWVLFRADTFGLAWEFFAGLAGARMGSTPDALALAVVGGCIGAQLVPADLGRRVFRFYARFDPALQSAAFGLWIMFAVALGPEGVAPFIYFQF